MTHIWRLSNSDKNTLDIHSAVQSLYQFSPPAAAGIDLTNIFFFFLKRRGSPDLHPSSGVDVRLRGKDLNKLG